MWEACTGRCLYSQVMTSRAPGPDGEQEEGREEDAGPRSLTHLLPMPRSSRLATVTAEHNIQLYQLPALCTKQQVCGRHLYLGLSR